MIDAAPFSAKDQCSFCGSRYLSSTAGYGGERPCLTCGCGGDGEPDVPCMYYKLARPPVRTLMGMRVVASHAVSPHSVTIVDRDGKVLVATRVDPSEKLGA